MTDIQTLIEPVAIDAPNKKVQMVKFVGQLDETNVDTEAQKIYKIFEESEGKVIVIFDLSDLSYLNSKSIGYITDWYNKAMEKGGKIIIAAPRDNVLDILKVVGLTNIIDFTITLEEAKLAAMNA